MNGQGRPKLRLAFRQRTWCFLAGLASVLCCALPPLHAETTSVRVRFEWNGPDPLIWIGSVSLPGGSFSDFRILGLDPDQPGAYVNQGERVLVSPRFASNASGFEAMVSGDLTDSIQIALTNETDKTQSVAFTMSLADILRDNTTRALGSGHELSIRRVTGDEIRVRFPRDSMVFAPGEKPKIDLRAMHVDAKPGSTLRARFRIRSVDEPKNDVTEFWQLDEDLWTRTESLRVNDSGQVEPLFGIDVPIPDEEGSYNLSIDLTHRLPAVGTVARRTIQFVVVDPRRPPLFGRGKSTIVTEFNPAHPDWRDYLTQLQNKSTLLPGLKKGPWSNGHPTVRSIDGTDWTQLAGDGWVAYSLHGAKPGIPHVLEVELPAHVEQDMGVSILEPKLDATWNSLHGDTGVSVGDQDLMLPGISASSERTRHRIVFWPQSSSPVVVLSNRSSEGKAAFGMIRLEAFQQGLPVRHPIKGTRKRIAVVDGEFLQTIFHASEDADSWQSFLLAGNRLVSYLRYAGYDGAMVKVASDGSTLFPSDLLSPTGKFDTGIFTRDRRDPFQKDVLEMLLQLFDREGLSFIPSLEFATPLPELEGIWAKQPESALGIELIDTSRRQASNLPTAASGLAAYYNPLDPRVQRAMGRVVNELVRRYTHHPSLGGVNIDCHAQGFTQLPGPGWGYDAATVNAFVADAKKKYPTRDFSDVRRKLALQIQGQTEGPWKTAWLDWRANRLTAFYAALADLVGRTEGRQLILSMTGLMQSQPWQHRLRPALPRETSVETVLMDLGLDVEALRQTEHLVVLRPNRIAPLDHLGSQAVNLEASEEDIQESFDSNGSSAVQFDYETQVVEHNRFNEDGPTRKYRHQFLSTTTRGGEEARRHLALSLAQHDDHWIFEGGNMLPFGQERARNAFFDVFRELPKQPFELLEFDDSGPIVVRHYSDTERTIAYFVNTSPWTATASIQWQSTRNVSITNIGNDAELNKVVDLGDRSSMEAKIEPYGIVALQFNSPRVQLVGCRTELPNGIAQQLKVQLDEIVSRGEQIESRAPANLLVDPSFEQELANELTSGPWTPTSSPRTSATIDTRVQAHGNSSLRLSSTLPRASVRVTSQEFLAPETGRLLIFVKLRKADANAQPPVILRLESSNDAYQPGHFFRKISADKFTEEGVNFVDLPTDPNLRLRISFELAGPGEVWIDEIRLYDRWILDEEKKDLKKIIFRAVTQERKGDLAACYQTLSGYWPRFLLRHVPPARVAARNPPPQPVPKPIPKPEKETRFFDFRGMLRRLRY